MSWFALLIPALVLGLGLFVHRVGRRAPGHVKARVAVVLGALVRPDGTPSDALVDRVRTAVALLQEGKVDQLLLTGGSPDGRPPEAAVMGELARALGVPASKLILEERSRSTFENARFSRPLLEALGVDTIALVTCDFHLARARAHFRTPGLTVIPVPSPRMLSAADRLMVTSREVIALLRRPWLLFR